MLVNLIIIIIIILSILIGCESNNPGHSYTRSVIILTISLKIANIILNYYPYKVSSLLAVEAALYSSSIILPALLKMAINILTMTTVIILVTIKSINLSLYLCVSLSKLIWSFQSHSFGKGFFNSFSILINLSSICKGLE